MPFLIMKSFAIGPCYGLADSSVVLVVKFWAKKENYWQARYTMLEDIKYGFDEAGL